MQCPKCQFEHESHTTECFKCGIVFEKYHRYQHFLRTLPPPTVDEVEGPGSLQEAREELLYRLLALPIMLTLAWLLVISPLAPLIRIFFTMWVHEGGHAVTAWLCGFGAVPGPWLTLVSPGRMPLVSVALACGLGWGIFYHWRLQHWFGVAGWSLLLLLQGVCTRLPAAQANALIIFGGDASCLVLGSLLMATLYARRDSALYRHALRWGFLVIGACAFMDTFEQWWGAQSNLDRIPFGENEGVGLSDPSRLIEEYGWAIQTMLRRYVGLGKSCLVALALLYVLGVIRARADVRLHLAVVPTRQPTPTPLAEKRDTVSAML